MQKSLAEAALEYVRQEMAPFPCRGKKPLTPNGFKDATKDPEKVRGYWEQFPDANIGLHTEGLLVLDVDLPHGPESLGRLKDEYGPLPDTSTAATPSGGTHYYFSLPHGVSLKNTAGRLGPGLDTRSDGGYVIAPPSRGENGGQYAWISCAPIAPAPAWLVDLVAQRPKVAPPMPISKSAVYGSKALAAEIAEVSTAPEGQRNHTLNNAAFSLGQLVAGGELEPAEVERGLLAAALVAGLPEDEARKTLASGLEAGQREPRKAPERPQKAVRAPEQVEAPELTTDMRTAEFFASTSPGVRYCPEFKKWLIYDGLRWTTDAPGGPYPSLKETIGRLYQHGREIVDDQKRQEFLKNVVSLESHSRQNNVLAAAEKIPAMIIPSVILDKDPYALNCRNGTLDLKTGQLRAHSREDFSTRLVNIDFDPDSTCPTFEKFIDRAMEGNGDLVRYIQRLIGYCLTGSTTEQKLAFFYGTGANGKTTLLNVVEQLLGDFSSTAAADLLMQRDNRGAGNDLAALRGSRVAAVSEFNDSDALDEARIKTLTGGDKISCRFLYGEFFEYRPTFKILLVGNHKPRIRGRDLGIWRRIHLVPFRATIPEAERDPHLDDKLRAELPGILAWAVRGCLEWQRIGLAAPEDVTAETEEYKRGEDILSQWVDECCLTGPYHQSTPKALLDSFIEFSNWRNLSTQKFGRMLSEAGFNRARSGRRYYEGLTLAD